jgi:hypothetical protein
MRYRKNTHDAPERPKPAEVAPSYIPILDQNKNQVGHVHGLKSKNPAPRFGIHNATLKKIRGIGLAWQGTTAQPSRGQADGRHAKDVRTAKGSVTRHATPPETSTRPKR